MILTKPFNDWKRNALNNFNELILVFSFLALLFTTGINISEILLSIIGWTIISLILLSLIITWLLLFPAVVFDLLEQTKEIILWLKGIEKKQVSKPEDPHPSPDKKKNPATTKVPTLAANSKANNKPNPKKKGKRSGSRKKTKVEEKVIEVPELTFRPKNANHNFI